MAKKHRAKLSAEQREFLEKLTTKGTLKVRTYKRVQILLLADEGLIAGQKSDQQIADQVKVATVTVQRVRQRFAETGLNDALAEKSPNDNGRRLPAWPVRSRPQAMPAGVYVCWPINWSS